MSQSSFTLKEVKTKNDLKEFIGLPELIYKSNPCWIRQPDKVILDYLDKKRNPFYRDGTGSAFIFLRDHQVVARVLVTMWKRHARLHGERVAYFGYFESIDDKETSTQLFSHVENYAKQNNCEILRGPFNTTAAQEMGILVGGYANVPAIDMVYTASWYPHLFKEAGFRACLAMETWRNRDISRLAENDLLDKASETNLNKEGITVRPISRSKKDQELELVRELVNSAFLGNWSFVPIGREEWKIQIGDLIPLLDPDLILIAEAKGVPVGVTFAVPDFNHLLKGMHGRLAHPRVLNLLNKDFFKDAVVILFAVRKQYQGMNIIKAINARLIKTLKDKKYRSLSVTWISKENQASLAQVSRLGMERIHELCMYEKNIQ